MQTHEHQWLIDESGIVLDSNPPQYPVHCECGATAHQQDGLRDGDPPRLWGIKEPRPIALELKTKHPVGYCLHCGRQLIAANPGPACQC